MIFLYIYLLIGCFLVGWDISREWDRERHGFWLPVLVFVFCAGAWPLYVAWKFHYLENE